MSEWKWALPHRIQMTLGKHIGETQNLGLLLDKFTPYAEYSWMTNRRMSDWQSGFVAVTEKRNPKGEMSYKQDKAEKGDWLRYSVAILLPNIEAKLDEALRRGEKPRLQPFEEKLHEEYKSRSSLPFDKELIEAYRKRWMATCDSYGSSYRWEMLTDASLIIGLGAEHILETAITLDRNTGLPIIPGSALKGLARTVGLVEIAQKLSFSKPDEKLTKLRELDSWLAQTQIEIGGLEKVTSFNFSEQPDAKKVEVSIARFRTIFGFVGCVGSVVFPDAIYGGDEPPAFAVDIMNPHFGDYYIRKEPPSDDQNPVPVPYLTVAREQRFRFAVLPRNAEVSERAVTLAKLWLQKGLRAYGIGAKASQGYGIFKDA
jgi:CRISPR-associated protein Cmr6